MKLVENEGRNPRLTPESEIDKAALVAFCCAAADGSTWKMKGDKGSVTAFLDNLSFDESGIARQLLSILPHKFNAMTFLDQESLDVSFWCEYDGYSNKVEAFWKCKALGQSNLIGYHIVF